MSPAPSGPRSPASATAPRSSPPTSTRPSGPEPAAPTPRRTSRADRTGILASRSPALLVVGLACCIILGSATLAGKSPGGGARRVLFPLVARAGVLAETDAVLAAARAGRGALVTVTG